MMHEAARHGLDAIRLFAGGLRCRGAGNPELEGQAMKTLVWVCAAVLALLWTAFAAVGASLVGWAGDVLASGGAAEWARVAAQWPTPGWLAWWIDPAAVKALQEALLWGLSLTQQALPWIGSAVGWLVPVVWLTWAVGLAVLLGLAGLAHVLVGRAGRIAVPGGGR
jgi:hypothetical protein